MEKNFKVRLLGILLRSLFKVLERMVKYRAVNYPQTEQFIISMWHADQCGLYIIKNPQRMNVLISQSNDGEIIAMATEGMGFKTVRGSQGRRGTEATFKLIEKLEQGENIAITVDGPKGPAKKVKKGIINIAKLSQVPIIPMVWQSKSKMFLKFNSWDGFKFPFGFVKMINLFGEPIYVPSDCDEEGIELYRKKLEDAMIRLDEQLLENYDEYFDQLYKN